MAQNEESLLTEKQVSAMLGLKQRTLQQWRLERKGPKFIKLTARVIRYKLNDVQDWLLKVQNDQSCD